MSFKADPFNIPYVFDLRHIKVGDLLGYPSVACQCAKRKPKRTNIIPGVFSKITL